MSKNYFPPVKGCMPTVGSDSCHTCGRDVMISALRQDWHKQPDGKHSLVLECSPCWEIRMDLRKTLASILTDGLGVKSDDLIVHGPFAVSIMMDDEHDNGDRMLVQVNEEITDHVTVYWYQDVYDPTACTEINEYRDIEECIEGLKQEFGISA